MFLNCFILYVYRAEKVTRSIITFWAFIWTHYESVEITHLFNALNTFMENLFSALNDFRWNLFNALNKWLFLCHKQRSCLWIGRKEFFLIFSPVNN